MREWFNRLFYLLRRSRHEADLREEMETHRSLRQEKLERDGLAPADAAAASRRAFGNAALAREDAREVWVGPALEGLWQDVRGAARSLRQRPAFTVAAVATLAVALGANIAIFSLVDRVVLRPLDVPNVEQLVTVEGVFESRGVTTRRRSMNWYYATRVRDMTTLSDAAIASVGRDRAAQRMTVTVPGRAETIDGLRGTFVTANYFRTLGLRVGAGRDFANRDDAPEAPPVVILGHGFWQRHFGGDPGMVGRAIHVNGTTALVVGIAPRAFAGTDLTEAPPDFYLPAATASLLATNTGDHNDGLNQFALGADIPRSPVSPLSQFIVIGRVDPADVGQAQAELSTLNDSGRLVRFLVGTSRWEVKSLVETMLPLEAGADIRNLLGLLAAAVGLTLLIGCANLAGLLLARGEERRAELAVRAALGAGRRRLVQATIAEIGLLALAGGIAALVVATGIQRALSDFVLPGGVALASLRENTDARTLLFAMFVTTVAAMAISLAPTLRAGTRNLALEARGRSTGAPRLRTSRRLLAVQVAVSVVLVFLAAIFVRSISNALGSDFGFDRRNLVSASATVPRGVMFDSAATMALSERVRRIPGVLAATVGPLPIAKGSDLRRADVQIDGNVIELPEPIDTVYADTDYFSALGLPLTSGRGFDDQDGAGAPLVAVINEAAARRFWPAGDAVGRRIGLPPPAGMRAQGHASPDSGVVGIVRDVKVRTIRETDQPVLYMPRRQHEAFLAGVAAGGGVSIAIRTVGEPAGIASALAAAASQSGLTLQSVTTLDQSLDGLLMPQRFGRALLSLLATMALLLTLLGTYGLVSCVVARGRKDIGIRMALGANGRQVVGALMRTAVAPLIGGVVLGAVIAWWGGRFVDSFTYGMSGSDPATLAIAVALIFGIAMFAALLPARRALRIHPIETLRSE